MPHLRGLLALAALSALPACKYQSQYSAPLDGHPRVVWTGDEVAADFAGAGLSYQCAETLAAVMDGAPLTKGTVLNASYNGALRDRLLERSVVFRQPNVAVGVFLGINLSSNSGGSSGVGGSSDKAAAILMVLAIAILGPIDMYLALAPPESSEISAEVIDLVNGYNEAVRLDVPGCAIARVHAPPQGPELKGTER